MQKKPLALIILDGYGLAEPSDSNAVALARTPAFDSIWQRGPRTTLQASGRSVGLPEGQMGNSEVGHLNLGAGRVVAQSLTYITEQIEMGRFFENPTLLATMDAVGSEQSLHLCGLASRGGVHSELEHLFALLEMAKRRGVRRTYLHLFTDGRDTAPSSAPDFIAEVMARLEGGGYAATVATVIGRYYAMDRDRRWDRVSKAYRTMVEGLSERTATDPLEAIRKAYAEGETDEFIFPTVIVDEQGEPMGPVMAGDSLIFFNFRADRGRELTYALVGGADWNEFPRGRRAEGLNYCSLMEYDAAWELPYAFALPAIERPLAEVLSDEGLTQYHTAETEKYPHVTFFFNATREQPYPGESRDMVPSPQVATYDLQPEMSAPELARRTAERIRQGLDDFVLINFANPDMVGHTGDLKAAILACEASDRGLQEVQKAIEERGGIYLVVADHGNAEQMRDENGEPHTAHTTNPVPFVIGGVHGVLALREGGVLADVAPTILELLAVEQPAGMTGRSLISRRV